jgi:hypothetical protein
MYIQLTQTPPYGNLHPTDELQNLQPPFDQAMMGDISKGAVAHGHSKELLQDYLDEFRQYYGFRNPRRRRSSLDMHPFVLQQLLLSYNSESNGDKLIEFVDEFQYLNFRLGYVMNHNERRWFNMTVGGGSITPASKRIVCGEIAITGIAVGRLEGTDHLVVIEPGLRVFLVDDLDWGHETVESSLIPYTIVPIFSDVEHIGSEFALNQGTNTRNFVVEDIEDEEPRE